LIRITEEKQYSNDIVKNLNFALVKALLYLENSILFAKNIA